jgi:DNA repair photolyase
MMSKMIREVSNPPNPWSTTEIEYIDEIPQAKLSLYEDHTREILSHNDSPDIPFRFSVNPYRGCFHACAYCYARPGHEYLSFGAGSDFDRKIVYKPHAAELLREAFERKKWVGDTLMFSGVTDCYQPLEASLRLTRQCLEVCAEYHNPVGIITKAPLVERDIDLLQTLHRDAQLHVTLSIPFWSKDNARKIEPGVATPERRMKTVARLAAAGISVGVNIAPLILGLNDKEVPEILRAAKDAGATRASFVVLRLPGSVKQVFEERLRETMPLAADKILHRIRDSRGGKLYDSRWGARQIGEGPYAEQAMALFTHLAEKLGLRPSALEDGFTASTFRRPPKAGAQLSLL